MLVMSLSPCWAKPFRTSPKQPKSLFFLGGGLVLVAPECQNPKSKNSRCTRRGLLGGPWMVLWTMLVHGFGSILGRFAAVLVFFASCPVSFCSSCDKFLEL